MGNKSQILTVICLLITAISAWDLQGENVTKLTGSEATLRCTYQKPEDYDAKYFHEWRDGVTGSTLFFNHTNVQDISRMSIAYGEGWMTLTIRDITLSDEKPYRCTLSGSGISQRADALLTVEQIPQHVHVTNLEVSPRHGTEAAIAKCSSSGSKPAPTMWFTDSLGQKVDVANAEIHTTDPETKLVDSALTLEKTFYKDDNGEIYKCHVKHHNSPVITKETNPVNVQYETTAYLTNAGQNELLQEGSSLAVSCNAEGNPFPTVEWSFTPDEHINISLPEGQSLPSNFALSGDGRTMRVESVTVTDDTSTNNGTFTCVASNSIGSPVQLSFHLGVYAAPVTTVPTTPEATAEMQPRSAGSDAAVIGGVVAVAVFVLIVAVVLIARYFMSHKGTYHTNEMKNHDTEENRNDDEHPMVDDEEDYGGKKRTEYFM
ncbi:cell adhesion molecule 3-like isoform X2 [Styela clava]